MSTTANLVGIKDSWSLMAFAKKFAKVKLAKFTNSETKEPFKSMAFLDSEDNVTLVGFSSNLGELTKEEIASMKNDLQVVMLATGTYKLCKQGDNNAWEDIDLGI